MGRPKADGRQGKKAKDPNKPKRATSAYFFFLAHCREDAKKTGKSISRIAEFTKECSAKWRDMDDRAKKSFEDKAAADKARYDKEMASYGGGGGKVKDPNMPKKPLTGYFHYLSDFREKNKGSDIPNKELLKLAGEKWRDMSDAEKLPFERKSQEEQKKYEVAMAAYRKGGAKSNGGARAMDDDDEDEEEEEEEDDEDDDE